MDSLSSLENINFSPFLYKKYLFLILTNFSLFCHVS
ncbi:hypothetical protein ACIQYL_03440 [Lysinibacillus xylanilyticus]